MQEVGVGSWRFSLDVGRMPHAALYVREALALEVPDGPANPPPLGGSVPDRRDVLDPDARRQAALDWPAWWDAVVAGDAFTNLAPEVGDGRTWLRDLATRAEGAGDPPEFAALADRPALRRAVVELMPEAQAWVEAPLRANRPPYGEPLFAWDLTRQVAEDVAFDRDVPIDAVNGVALVLVVRGSWWVRHSPGVVLCSAEATRDATTGHAVLRAAFESGLFRR